MFRTGGSFRDEVLGDKRAAFDDDAHVEMIEAFTQCQGEGFIDAGVGFGDDGAVDGDGAGAEGAALGALAQFLRDVADPACNGGFGFGCGLKVPQTTAAVKPTGRRRHRRDNQPDGGLHAG